MKVVLFCGGLGTRLREYSDTIPKPLANIGHRPILWHLMRYYAHYGHTDFILCLGYGGHLIREFFLNYNEAMSNDFVLAPASGGVHLLTSDVRDWRITFVDTGLNTTVAERLVRVRRHLAGESAFLANYADGLTDLPLPRQIADFERRDATVSFMAVPPALSFHGVSADEDGVVTKFGAMRDAGFWVNAGFFCMRPDVFDYIREGEDLAEQPFRRLIEHRRLAAYRYKGFWQQMDTFKDKLTFDGLDARGECPWMVWKREEPAPAPAARRSFNAVKAATTARGAQA